MFFLILFFVLPISLYCPKTPPPTEDTESKIDSPLVKPTSFIDPGTSDKLPQAQTDEDSTSAEPSPETPRAKPPKNTSPFTEDPRVLSATNTDVCAGAGCGSSDLQPSRRKSRLAIVDFPPLLPKQTTISTPSLSLESETTIERIFAIENKEAEAYFLRHPGFHDLWIRKFELVTNEITALNKELESLMRTSREEEIRALKTKVSFLQSYCDRLAILINPFHYGKKQGEFIYHTLNKSEWPILDHKLNEEISRLKRIIAETETPFRQMTEESDLIYFITLKASFLWTIYENGPYIKSFNYEQAGRENGLESYHKLTYDKLLDLCKAAREHHEKRLKLHEEGVVTKVTLKHLAMVAYWTGFETALERQMLAALEE